MNNYLFSQPILILTTLLVCISCGLFIRKYWRVAWQNKRRLLLLLAVSVCGLIGEIFAINRTFGLQNIPALIYPSFYLLNGVVITLILYARSQRSFWILGIWSTLSIILFILVTTNSFYQYYPTITSIFSAPSTSNQRTTTFGHLGQQNNTNSLEQRLFASGTSNGSIVTTVIPGIKSSLKARDSYIYLPPAYQDASFAQQQFPVLLLLTGTPGTPSSWLQSNLFISTMNDFARHHNGITPIVAIVDHSGSFTNDTECLDSSHGNAETYLTSDIPQYLLSHYRISNNPENWGIGGFSEGGMCAAMLTLTHQDRFLHFLDMSGDPYPYLDDRSQTVPVLFHGSKTAQTQHNIDWLLQHTQINPKLTAQFAIGESDRKVLVSEMRYTYHLATKRHITTSFELMQNQGHTFGFWSKAYANALPKLSNYLGATACQTDCLSD